MTYTVAYWMGGSQHGSWKRCLPVATQAEAEAQAAGVVHAGRPAYVYETDFLNVIGTPDDAPPSWDFDKLAWKPGAENAGSLRG